MITSELSHQLTPFLPEGTADLCAQWLIDHKSQLTVSRPRKTKLGDFRPAQKNNPHRISINNDLSPLQFLITFAHEIAHVQTWSQNGRKVAPHGLEWKNNYRHNLYQILDLNVLDGHSASVLKQHSLNPKASSCADGSLQNLSQSSPPGKTLNTLQPETIFQIENGKVFKAIRKLRTFWLCEEPSTGKFYRVRGTISVSLYGQSI